MMSQPAGPPSCVLHNAFFISKLSFLWLPMKASARWVLICARIGVPSIKGKLIHQVFPEVVKNTHLGVLGEGLSNYKVPLCSTQKRFQVNTTIP